MTEWRNDNQLNECWRWRSADEMSQITLISWQSGPDYPIRECCKKRSADGVVISWWPFLSGIICAIPYTAARPVSGPGLARNFSTQTWGGANVMDSDLINPPALSSVSTPPQKGRINYIEIQNAQKAMLHYRQQPKGNSYPCAVVLICTDIKGLYTEN